VEFSTNADYMNDLSVWATSVVFIFIWRSTQMCWSQFQLLFLALLTTFWNAVVNSDCTCYDLLFILLSCY